MCGIVGFVGTTKRKDLERMLALLKHRGPDGEGVFWSGNAGLGNRRLAIIDRKGGSQPQTNEDGTLTITYNGEIYNFEELRRTLVHKGHRFQTRSDTEVILHAYEEYGTGCVTKFNGMFAFAIWDSKHETLFAARDHFGIKPFFYTQTRNNLLFASEIKSLLTHPEVKTEVNLEAIASYLTLRYVPEPETIFLHIKHLKPAHYLIFRENKILTKRYWEFPEEQEQFVDEQEVVEEFLRLLEESVRKRLISEVPIGSYISGGVDSALITTLAAKMTKNVKAFNVPFEDDRYDESKYASLISRSLKLKPKTTTLKKVYATSLPTLIWFLDQPLADAAIIPTYYMSQAAKRDVGVVLSGDGADELLAGYDYYQRLVYGRVLYRIMRLLPFLPENSIVQRIISIGKTTSSLEQGDDIITRFRSHTAVFNDQEKREIVQPGLLQCIEVEKRNKSKSISRSKTDHLSALLKHDLSHWLPADILLKTDRMTMAHGLEARLPFLDHHLVEFAMKLPAHLKLRGRTDKYIERQAAAKIIPKEIAQREKHGFDVPLEQFQPLAKHILSKQVTKSRGWFIPEKINELVHGTKDDIQRQQVFCLLILEIWAQIFLDKKDPQQCTEKLQYALRSHENENL